MHYFTRTQSGSLIALMFAMFGLVAPLSATPIVIDSAGADGWVRVASVSSDADLIVGLSTGSVQYNGIALFELPDRSGGQLLSAEIKLKVQNGGTLAGANYDLWGLGYVTGTPALAKIWFLNADSETRTGTTLGTNIGSSTPTRIADNFFASGSYHGGGSTWTTNTSQNATLLSFLNGLYNNHGAAAGDYAVFRINPDGAATNSLRFTGSHQSPPSQLTVTIPEPQTITLLLLGALILSAIRWRQGQRPVAC